MHGFPGQITSTSDAFATSSLVLEKSSAPFGVVLVDGDDGLCRLPDKDNILEEGATTGKAAGILIQHIGDGLPCTVPLVAPIGSGETVYAKIGEAVSLLKVGSVFVKTETDVTRGEAVFYRVTSSDVGLLGAIRSDVDANRAVQLNGAVFGSSANAGDIVQIDVNLNTVQESY
jgi:hypothetical protein